MDIPSERRKEPRTTAQGEVRIWLNSPPLQISARLLDTSSTGFRTCHDYAGIAAGQEVWFQHCKAEGRARVVWTRVLPKRMEAGFFILENNCLDLILSR